MRTLTQVRQAEREKWGRLLDAAQDAAEFAALARPLATAAKQVCTCLDGSCNACRLWRLIDKWSR